MNYKKPNIGYLTNIHKKSDGTEFGHGENTGTVSKTR